MGSAVALAVVAAAAVASMATGVMMAAFPVAGRTVAEVVASREDEGMAGARGGERAGVR